MMSRLFLLSHYLLLYYYVHEMVSILYFKRVLLSFRNTTEFFFFTNKLLKTECFNPKVLHKTKKKQNKESLKAGVFVRN